MTTGDTIKSQGYPNFETFYNGQESLIPELKNYITYALLATENQGLIDRSYYDPDGILDEVFLEVFKELSEGSVSVDPDYLLFKRSLGKIEKLIRDEVNTPNEPSTSGILKQELDALDKKFTVDAGGDWMFQEELDDISYQQKQGGSGNIYLDDKLVEQLVARFELEDKFIAARNKRLLGMHYSAIPDISRSIVELFAYGNRSKEEIAKILDVERASVQRVLKIVHEKFELI